MGRKRKDESEIVKTISINLKQHVLDEIAKEGVPKKVIESIITERYGKK